MCDYFIINDIKRSIIPPLISITKKVPGKIGERLIKNDLGTGIIEVDITIEGYGKKFRNDVRTIASILYTEEEKRLIFSDEPDKFYKAILSGDTRLTEIISLGEGTLSFLCPNPLAYSVNPTIEENIHNRELENKGTYKTRGVIEVTLDGDLDHLEVKLLNTGEKIYIEDELKNGDVILVDLEQEFVKKNNVLIMDKLYLESDFFDIPVGEFAITISSGIGDLTYNERWL